MLKILCLLLGLSVPMAPDPPANASPLFGWTMFAMTDLAYREEGPAWSSTYADTAESIAAVSPDVKTAAILVAIAWRESRFNPAALGDCKRDVKGKPIVTLATCQSVDVFQISKDHAPAEVLLDPASAAVVARRLVERSFEICSRAPLADRLGWYAAGGNGCRGLIASRNRMHLAGILLRLTPPP